jgi:polyhydroxyalkanoate synthesis regulator phasin
MLELIKKSLLASLGAAVVTKDKIHEATLSLVDQGKISAEEAEKLADELVKSGQHEWDEVQAKISESVRKGMDGLDISSKTEFQQLKERVENLEKRIAMMETAQAKD